MTTLKEEMDLVLYEVDENRMENPNARINTEDEAGWTLARLAALNADIEEIKKDFEERIAKFQKWFEGKKAARELEMESRRAQLMIFAETQLALSKKKAVDLPDGRYGFRNLPPRIERDEKTLLEYVKKEDPKNIRVQESIDWAALKKKWKVDGNNMINPDTGEVIPGVTVYKQDKRFFVEVK